MKFWRKCRNFSVTLWYETSKGKREGFACDDVSSRVYVGRQRGETAAAAEALQGALARDSAGAGRRPGEVARHHR